MRLSVQLLQQLVATAVGDQTDAGLRGARRILLAGRAQVFPLQGDQLGRAALANLRNISVESIAFHSDVAMGLDSQFIICLAGRRGDVVRLTCTVRRCERVPIGPTAYLIAATFEQVLEASTHLISDFDHSPQAPSVVHGRRSA
jgi:hypothetical protein